MSFQTTVQIFGGSIIVTIRVAMIFFFLMSFPFSDFNILFEYMDIFCQKHKDYKFFDCIKMEHGLKWI